MPVPILTLLLGLILVLPGVQAERGLVRVLALVVIVVVGGLLEEECQDPHSCSRGVHPLLLLLPLALSLLLGLVLLPLVAVGLELGVHRR